ncbi:MAG: hypothetical protein DRJ52_05770 [Thermoprotei archaeon]|nr:MAG: hypothetical protein DRJ52_05770 [Thermoprotei archaeon]RLE98676.1 MAG: hypothetical protein DRJ63_07360 [Thermoprotei archaeon]
MTIRLAFIGAGVMNQLVHIPNFMSISDCEVVALCELREKLGRAVAAMYHIPRYYKSHLDIIDVKDIDACVVAVADELHAPIVLDLLKSGKDVFVEKPIATNSDDAREMVKCAEKNNRILMVGYMKRYDPGCRYAKDLVSKFLQEGSLGKVIYARVHCYGGDWTGGLIETSRLVTTDEPKPKVKPRPPKWLDLSEYCRYRAFLDVFCHDVNLMRWFLGEPEKIICSSFCDDMHNSIISYGDFSVGFETGFIKAHFWDEELKIYFEKGWIEVKPPPPLLRNTPSLVEVYSSSERTFKRYYGDWRWAFREEAEHFIKCVKEDREPLTSSRDALRDIELIENLYRRFLEAKQA